MSELKSRPSQNEPAAPVSLADLAQLAELGARSERLRVLRDGTEGVVFIERGAVVHASIGELSGERAAHTIFRYPEQPAERLAFEAPPARSLELRPSQLLLTFAVEEDELTRHEAPAARRASSVPPAKEQAELLTPSAGPVSAGPVSAGPVSAVPASGSVPSLPAADGYTSAGTERTPGTASFRSITGTGRSSPGSSPGSASFRTQTGSEIRSSVTRSEGMGWLWRAFALFCVAGIASYSYFRFVANSGDENTAQATEVPVVDAESLTGMTDVVPRLIQERTPKRPDVESALQPTVLVRALVSETGQVSKTEVVESRPELEPFETAAVEAVKGYRFKPAQQAGRVVAAWMNVPVSFAKAGSTAVVTLRGSLGFESLAQELGKQFKDTGDASLKYEMDGAAPCINALLEGAADVCFNTRPISKPELETAKAVGVELQEHVLGYAHASVIVHPLNPLQEMNVSQLAELFSGKHAKWSELEGGQDWPVKLLGVPLDSVSADAFRTSVMGEGDDAAAFSPDLELLPDPKSLFDVVAKTPGAIAYAPTQAVAEKMKQGNEHIKPMPIAEGQRAATKVSAQSVAQRTYPIRGQVWAYSRAALDQHTHAFLSLVFSKTGRATMLLNDVAPGPQLALPRFESPADVSLPEVFHVQFIAGSVGLDVPARLRLDKAALKLAESDKRWAIVVGHADPTSEPSQQEHLAEKRAEVAKRYLTAGGLGQGRVEISHAAATRPRTGKTDRQSQYMNRRVDVYVVERD